MVFDMKYIRSFFILLFILLTAAVSAQSDFPRDTSFTLNNAYQKDRKKFPDIRTVTEYKGDDIRTQKNILYKEIGDRKLLLDIYAPAKQDRKYPCVIMIHGGGWRSGDKDMMAGFASNLSLRGYVVLSVGYRLSLEAKYPAAVHDLEDAIVWARKHADQYQIDKRKIVPLGTSSGGQLASLLGTNTHSDRRKQVQATVNIDGILAFHHPESAEGEVAALWLGGKYEEVPKIWEQASALYQVSKRTAPVLFLNSSFPRFHAGRDDMILKLKKYGTDTELCTFDPSPHTFWFYEPWFTPMLEKIDHFLNRVL